MMLGTALKNSWTGVLRGLGKAPQKDAGPSREDRVQVVPQPFLTVPLTEQKLLNDDSVYAVYAIFKDILLGAGYHWEGKDAERYAPMLDLVTGATGWPQLLDEIAAAPFQRTAIVEMIWQQEGQWLPERFRVMPLGATFVGLDASSNVEQVRITTTAGLQYLPLPNAVVHRNRPTFAHPLGVSVYDHLIEVIGYKRRTDEAVVRYVERFGAPSVIGHYRPGTPADKQKELLTALAGLQKASYGAIPQGDELEILEPQGSGGAIGVAMEMVGRYERRIARAVLGSVLAIFESEFGTRAQAEVHMEVLKAVVAARQAEVEEPINKQVIGPILTYNVGDKVDVQWKLNPPALTNMNALGVLIADLATAGVLDPVQDGDAIREMVGLGARKGQPPADTGAEE